MAHQRVAPASYQRHVGLAVPVRQLALAYYQTYGLQEDFTGKRGRRINVGGYRFAVRVFIPDIAAALTVLHRKIEPHDPDTPEVQELRKQVDAVAAENNWDKYRHHAGIGTYSLAALIFILPKIGPLKLSAIKGPTVATEADYAHSVAFSTGALRGLLARFTPPPATKPTAASAAPADTHSQPPPSRAACRPIPMRNRPLRETRATPATPSRIAISIPDTSSSPAATPSPTPRMLTCCTLSRAPRSGPFRQG